MSALVDNLSRAIIQPLIGLLFALALLLFFWGIFQFISNADNEEGRDKGKRHMIWGILGMFIILSVWGILGVLGATFGFEIPSR
jgi:cell division protein FtsW (lipid II flippase)|tara:strand:+ start:78 stop:329 length:252 start_codon:yes stop_codon:yes gene_type:complete